MKKQISALAAISAILLLHCFKGYAQWTHAGTNTYLSSSGDNVGIGTTAPSYKLDIKNAANCNFRVQSTASGSANLILARASDALNCLVNYKTGTNGMWYTGCYGNNDFSIINGSSATNFFISQATGNVGIGMITPDAKLDVAGIDNWDLSSSAGDVRIGTPTYNLKIGVALNGGGAGNVNIAATNLLLLGTGSTFPNLNTLSMIGGQVGIGVLYPTSKLDVAGNIKTTNFQMTTGAAAGKILQSDASGNASWQTPSGGSAQWTTSGNNIYNSNSGNVGIGTSTPNAPLQLSNATANRKIVLYEAANNDNQFEGFGLNFGSLRYQVNNAGDDHIFYAGTSATTSNELMRIKGNGNVGIGTTTPTSKLDVNGQLTIDEKNFGGHGGLLIKGDVPGNNYPNIAFSVKNNAATPVDVVAGEITGVLTNAAAGSEAMDLSFSTSQTGVGGLATRLYIKDNGNVGIGTNTPAQKLDVNGNIQTSLGVIVDAQNNNFGSAAYALIFGTAAGQSPSISSKKTTGGNQYGIDFHTPNGGYAMSITPSGKVGIGTVTPTTALEVASSDITALKVQTTYSGGTAITGICNLGTGAVGVYGQSYSGTAGYFTGNVYCNGTYGGSDERLKENIMPAQNALEKVMKLEVKTYNFKSEYDRMNLAKGKQTGFIAQNLETIFPELVKTIADKTDPKGLFEFKAVNYAGMVPVLTKAMQEQQKQIEAKEISIEELKKENTEVKTKNQSLENRLNDLQQCLESLCNTNSQAKTSNIELPISNILLQNQPNPFNQSTVIGYRLLSDSKNAGIVIRNLNGELLKTITLNQTGKGQITINANELSQGTYTYTLIVNNQSVDTKLMVITK